VSLYILVPKRKVSLVNRSVIRDFFIEDVESEPRRILKSIILFTFAIELSCAAVLSFAFARDGSSQPVLDGLFHAVSAFCNAGFSTYNDSLAGFKSDYVVLATIMFLIVSGGIGFTVLTDIFDCATGKKRRMSFHSRIVCIVTALLILFGASVFLLLEWNNALRDLPIPGKIFAAFFQSITPRTAGFEVVPQHLYNPVSKLLTLLFMFIGGSPGSIAGGVKTTTFLIVFLYAIRGNTDREGLNIRKRNLDTSIIEKSFSIVAKSLMIVVVSLVLMMFAEVKALATGSWSVFDLLFEVVSAFGTVGLSQGITGSLTVWGKVVIICTMFIGRTGIFAMALGFSRNEKERYFEYPSASIMVG
jgi:trk system potassium uptake protein TrkH